MKQWWIGGAMSNWITDGLQWYRCGVRYRDAKWTTYELQVHQYKQIPALRALLLIGDI